MVECTEESWYETRHARHAPRPSRLPPKPLCSTVGHVRTSTSTKTTSRRKTLYTLSFIVPRRIIRCSKVFANGRYAGCMCLQPPQSQTEAPLIKIRNPSLAVGRARSDQALSRPPVQIRTARLRPTLYPRSACFPASAAAAPSRALDICAPKQTVPRRQIDQDSPPSDRDALGQCC